MKILSKRLEALEQAAVAPVKDWAPILERLSDAELDQLEAVVMKLESGASIDDLSPAEHELAVRVSEMAV